MTSTAAASGQTSTAAASGQTGTAATSGQTGAAADGEFLRDLLVQLRASDTYGRLDDFADSRLLAPYVLDSARRAEIPLDCAVDPATEGRLRVYYQAVAAGIEKATGVMTAVAVDLNEEGFGRALVLAGRLVVVSDTLRDAQRFGFASAGKLAARGERAVTRAVALVNRFPEVARADD
jgi:probable nitrogen fixation protein